ncbi:3-oxoacid CoA-transferase [Bacillus sp. FJAT-29790]|uniref:CoA-transferase subunit beta n=1 Tax=Bacillus sp. FJAT-29790 TaxID=1895002 RepID=UPI001C24A939|nr:CoA-transferase [Bacillus sp. FJAT-29790]MBU8880349.1 3-oxoacid CoA-transferase [Bacillus sp. FJAT-29790]
MANEIEKMIIAASRLLPKSGGVFVGTGMPLLASTLALNTHAPDLLLVFEGGGVGGKPTGRLPIQVSESLTYENGVIVGSMDYVMCLAQAGWIQYGFLGGAQIDQYGNLNTTVIGDWEQPKVRLPGSGGGADLASLCERTIILMGQDRKKFVQKLDFLTSPGYLTGPGERKKVGLPANTGPYRVITQLGIYGFDEETKKMTLLQLFEGYTLEDVEKNSSFPITVSEDWSYIQPPTEQELEALRSLDPDGIVLA